MAGLGCTATPDTAPATTQSVIEGRVSRDGLPFAGAYVRLLDRTGEFTAEVATSVAGSFRFFATPGGWTLRALAPGGTAGAVVTADAVVTVAAGAVTHVTLTV